MKPIEQANGEFIAEVNGKPRTFKFGMLAAKLVEKQGEGVSGNYEMMGLTLWAGLMCRFEQNDLPTVFTIDTMLDWMDTMSDQDLAQALVISKTAFERIPNVNSLVEKLLGQLPDGSPVTLTGSPSRKQLTK
ncbi:hypothetical protein [Spirosoma endbachense]|uniref:Tail assembly chaperone n=1 Tax=Spirosoma endbachense TaxID=2666025 RepID=A0A6P1VY17_9BACT|nr:hypothetical protein [Spirosoma endbachense]QHV96296.1 hypothetical protein GJR95_15285 [Spirosoma endbachense]